MTSVSGFSFAISSNTLWSLTYDFSCAWRVSVDTHWRRSTYPYIFSILVPFIRYGDRERFPLAKTKRPLDLKLLREGRVGRVGTFYSGSSKLSLQHILTYLPSYCKNNICSVWVVYPETVTCYSAQLNVRNRVGETHSRIMHMSSLCLRNQYRLVLRCTDCSIEHRFSSVLSDMCWLVVPFSVLYTPAKSSRISYCHSK